MKREPIDYNSPLGISKREWTRVLGVNLALLLAVYAVALICTLCGSDLFLLNFHSDNLQRIEETLRKWHMFPIVQTLFAMVEMTIMACYVAKAKPKWWYSLSYLGTYIGINVLFTQIIGAVPPFMTFLLTAIFVIGFVFVNWKPKEKWFIYLYRFAICYAVTFILNEGISLFRLKAGQLWLQLPNSIGFALNIEYDLALVLAFGFLTLLIPWKKKGGSEPCPTSRGAFGSSPNMPKPVQKSGKTAKTDIPPQIKKRLRLLKAKFITIQTIGIIVIAALPWFTGRPVEFALVYVSFCLTRLILGFGRSLHFESEMVCLTSGALTFWGLTFLVPSAEVLVITSIVYGAGTALGFRLYWELHDLMMYKKATKTDRFAMLYVVFDGDCNPKHINGMMRSMGFSNKDDIKMVQLYMQREKVEYIADWMGYAKITVEKKLTDLANDLYRLR